VLIAFICLFVAACKQLTDQFTEQCIEYLAGATITMYSLLNLFHDNSSVNWICNFFQ